MRARKILFMYVMLAVTITVSAQVEKREIKVEKGHTYLNLPVKNDNTLVRSRVKIKDQIIDQFTIKLA
ncbi:MAG TPA: hypothetical protein PLJ08_04945, partial [Cyclobacteriaceae bacterium]|nr:hypothetical protein [Cyclobacteriaceae bacterium]